VPPDACCKHGSLGSKPARRTRAPWVSIIVDEGEDAEEAEARYFAAPPEHVGRNVILK
jgi:hypothetical protein